MTATLHDLYAAACEFAAEPVIQSPCGACDNCVRFAHLVGAGPPSHADWTPGYRPRSGAADELNSRQPLDADGLSPHRFLTGYTAESVRTIQGNRFWRLTVSVHGPCAVLSTDRDGHVHWLDEAVSNDLTTVEQDAEAILRMLDRNGVTWRGVDVWVGDMHGGESRYLVRKAINLLRKHLAYQTKTPISQFPRIEVPTKRAGSVVDGLHRMNEMFRVGRATVQPRCERLRRYCATFEGESNHPDRAAGNAARYTLPRQPALLGGLR